MHDYAAYYTVYKHTHYEHSYASMRTDWRGAGCTTGGSSILTSSNFQRIPFGEDHNWNFYSHLQPALCSYIQWTHDTHGMSPCHGVVFSFPYCKRTLLDPPTSCSPARASCT